MRDCKIVWIASMPRVGSMWSFNVARALIARAGFQVRPQEALIDRKQILAMGGAGLRDTDPLTRWVLKTHDLIPPKLAKSLFIVPQRDPRDAMLSAHRFLRLPDLEAALAFTVDSLRTVEHYESPDFADRILRLDYALIAEAPREVIKATADYLEIDTDPASLDELAARFDKEAIAGRIRRLGEDGDGTFTVGNADGTSRLFDRSTGFQSGHVSAYRDGDWRQVLTAAQLALVERRLGPWLAKRGYPPTLGS